jgi:hypothetical protein
MPHPFRYRLAGALCAGLLLLAGCGTSHDKGQGVLGSMQGLPGTGGSAGVGLPGGSPTPGATASSGSPGSPGGTGTPTTTPTSAPPSPSPSASTPYPSDYAVAILDAWAKHNLVRLTLLTNATDAAQFLTIGDPDRHWTAATGAGGAAGSTYPAFYNANGDWLVLKLNDADLAGHIFHAGRLYTWDPISFPNAATAYAKEFVDGWINGNKARMTKLSSTTITNYFLTLTAPDFSYTLGSPDSGAGHTHVEVSEASVSLDTALSMVLSTLGHAHAIDGCTPGCP